MRTTIHATLTTLALAVVLTSCSSDGSGEAAGAPTATVTVTETVTASPSADPSESATDEASEAPSDEPMSPDEPNTGDRALKVGQWREGLDIRTRVTEFFQPANAQKPSYLQGESDGDGALAKVEMCVRNTSEPMKGQLYDLFFGYDASGGQYTQSSSSWEDWPPLPQLPNEASIAPGKCLSGWVLFTAPKNTKFVTVDMGDGEGGSIAEWKVG